MHSIDKFNKVHAKILEETSVDLCMIYCAQTGRPIGTIDSDEFIHVIELMPTASIETLADEFLTRTLAFTRPSPFFGNLTPDTMKHLLESRPLEMLAYLVNRYFQPASDKSAPKLTFEMRIASALASIKNYKALSQWYAELPKETLDELLTTLLFVDSHLSLTSQTPSATCVAPYLWQSVDDIQAFAQSIAARKSAWLKTINHLQATLRWQARNSVVRDAYIAQFWSVRPESKTAAKSKAKAAATQATLDILSNLFDDIGTESKPSNSKPAIRRPKRVSFLNIVIGAQQ